MVRRWRGFGGATAGFTLIEVMVVVLIIGLLAAAVVPSVIGRVDEARLVRARSDVRALDTAVKLFKADVGRYPTQDEGLAALIEEPASAEGWAGPYLDGYAEVPRDPWHNAYHYFRNVGGSPPCEIVCYGADGKPGGSDDDADMSSAALDR